MNLLRRQLIKSGRWAAFLVGVATACGSIHAQTVVAGTNQPDRLMNLMLSQPKIDINSPVTVTAQFDPPVVRPGQLAIYRVSLNALIDSIAGWPDELPAPAGLKTSFAARGQTFQFNGRSMVPRSSLVHHVYAESNGVFTIPAFEVKVYGKSVSVPAAQIAVVTDLPAGTPQARRLGLDLPRTNVFIGQSVPVRVLLRGDENNTVHPLRDVKLNGEGFLVDDSAVRQTFQQVDGRATCIYELMLVPILSGDMTFSAQGFPVGAQFGGSIVINGQATIPGGEPDFELLDSDTAVLHVKSLPEANQLTGFSGAIGKYIVEPPELSTNVVRTGEPVTLMVAVRGEADVGRLIPPPPPRSRNWQVFSADSAMTNVPVSVVSGPGGRMTVLESARFFAFTMVPLNDREQQTPAIPFSCFDPEHQEYVDLTIPPVPIRVLPTENASDQRLLAAAQASESTGEARLVLGDLAKTPGRGVATLVPLQQRAWFPLVQLAPAVFFGGLWIWDRRRRYLEQHPDVVRRRRARRALGRERRALRRAVMRRDADGFAMHGVNALRVISAPHYPAEPRALVCSDILRVIEQTSCRNGEGELVKQMFTTTDASRFSEQVASASSLLESHADLERLLEKLEECL